MTSVVRRNCPTCGMHMIVIKDFQLAPDKRTYECLRCGHVAEPDPRPTNRPGGAKR